MFKYICYKYENVDGQKQRKCIDFGRSPWGSVLQSTLF